MYFSMFLDIVDQFCIFFSRKLPSGICQLFFQHIMQTTFFQGKCQPVVCFLIIRRNNQTVGRTFDNIGVILYFQQRLEKFIHNRMEQEMIMCCQRYKLHLVRYHIRAIFHRYRVKMSVRKGGGIVGGRHLPVVGIENAVGLHRSDQDEASFFAQMQELCAVYQLSVRTKVGALVSGRERRISSLICTLVRVSFSYRSRS